MAMCAPAGTLGIAIGFVNGPSTAGTPSVIGPFARSAHVAWTKTLARNDGVGLRPAYDGTTRTSAKPLALTETARRAVVPPAIRAATMNVVPTDEVWRLTCAWPPWAVTVSALSEASR